MFLFNGSDSFKLEGEGKILLPGKKSNYRKDNSTYYKIEIYELKISPLIEMMEGWKATQGEQLASGSDYFYIFWFSRMFYFF